MPLRLPLATTGGTPEQTATYNNGVIDVPAALRGDHR
jgi:hypothetical protein